MRMQNKLGAAILATVLLGAGAIPATAQKSADTLRIVAVVKGGVWYDRAALLQRP